MLFPAGALALSSGFMPALAEEHPLEDQMRVPVSGVLAILGSIAVLGCGDPDLTESDCVPEAPAQTITSSSSAETWQERLIEYADTHPADEEVVIVVEPFTSDIKQELENLGARAFYIFRSFNGLASIIEAGKLPEVVNIEGITRASLGSSRGVTGRQQC